MLSQVWVKVGTLCSLCCVAFPLICTTDSAATVDSVISLHCLSRVGSRSAASNSCSQVFTLSCRLRLLRLDESKPFHMILHPRLTSVFFTLLSLFLRRLVSSDASLCDVILFAKSYTV